MRLGAAANPADVLELTTEAWAVAVTGGAAGGSAAAVAAGPAFAAAAALVQMTSSRPTLSVSPGAIAFQLARLRMPTRYSCEIDHSESPDCTTCVRRSPLRGALCCRAARASALCVYVVSDCVAVGIIK